MGEAMNALKKAENEMLNKLFALHGSIKTPTCDICQKPCNKFQVSYKPLERKYIFELECHGDKCELFIYEDHALDPRYEIMVNTAFTPDLSRIDGIVKGTIN